MQEAKITLTVEEVHILNDIIHNSVPSTKFGTVAQLIAKINGQLKSQFDTAKEDEVVEVEAE